MTRYAAFLRGVNVGGVNLKMAEVAAALEDAGFTNVKTILASGNVLLESRSGVDAVRKKAEKALRDEFGYDAWVLAYDLDTVRAISDAFPFEREVDGPPLLRHVRHRRGRARRTGGAGQGRRSATRRSSAARASSTGRSPTRARWTPPSARRWERSATSRRRPRATCARSTRCCDETCDRDERPPTPARRTAPSDRRLRDGAADAAGARQRGAPAGLRSSMTRWRSSSSTPSTSTSPSSASPAARTWRCARWPSTSYTRRYLVDHPAATVVALAEGLQTSFYRLDAAGVGRPVPLAHCRSAADHRVARNGCCRTRTGSTMCAQSALDYSWMDRVDPSDGVFITTEGLLMYLQPDEALGLIAECAKRFPGGQMMFDLPPALFAAWIRRGIAHVAALPGAADAVHAVAVGASQTWSTPCPASAPCTICRCRRAAAKCSTR